MKFIQNMQFLEGKVFEVGAKLVCKSVFLDFVHRLYFKKITFRKLDLLPSSGKKGRTETLAVEPRGWASLRPGSSLRSEASSTRGPNN
jgi:hypothetical protein